MLNRMILRLLEFTDTHLSRTHYRYRRDLWRETLSAEREKLWYCKIRGQHRIKFGSNGRCIRCGIR